MKIVLVTGGFDPLHSGHIAYFKAAKQLGNLLVVGINSDDWLTRKKGRAFMPAHERKAIIENIYQVHKVIEFDDTDNSAIDAIRKVKAMFPRDHIVFANGGDRTKDNIPEMVFDDVEFIFGVGGEDKKNSSSWIAIVNRTMDTGYILPPVILQTHDEYCVPVTEWHQLTNPYDVPVKVVEIQYGENCIEEDIERK